MSKNQTSMAIATVLSVFAIGQIPGSIDAAISKIADAFSLSPSSGLYVTTIASLVSVFFGILTGILAGKKIAYRKILLFSASVEVFSAILAFFCTQSFMILLLMRALFGLGLGAMMSLENTLATVLIPEERRAKILGLAMFIGFGSNCVLQYLGGLLADLAWNYVFLNHLLLLIPLILLFICCPTIPLSSHDSRETQEKGLSSTVFITAFVMLFVGMLIAPLLIGCSFLSVRIIDSAKIAGIVAVCFSIGCMSGGLLYPRLFNRFHGRSTAVAFIILTIGMLGCAITRNIYVLCIFIYIAGIGFTNTQSSLMMLLGIITSKNQIAFASAIFMAFFNLGMFLSGIFENFIEKITGDGLYMPIFIGAGVYFCLAVIYFVHSPFPKMKELS